MADLFCHECGREMRRGLKDRRIYGETNEEDTCETTETINEITRRAGSDNRQEST